MGSTKKCAEQLRIGNKVQEVSIYEKVIVPMALYGAEAWAMRSAERRK